MLLILLGENRLVLEFSFWGGQKDLRVKFHRRGPYAWREKAIICPVQKRKLKEKTPDDLFLDVLLHAY